MRSCRRLQLYILHFIYEDMLLDMHLRFCNPRRSQVAPLSYYEYMVDIRKFNGQAELLYALYLNPAR